MLRQAVARTRTPALLTRAARLSPSQGRDDSNPWVFPLSGCLDLTVEEPRHDLFVE